MLVVLSLLQSSRVRKSEDLHIPKLPRSLLPQVHRAPSSPIIIECEDIDVNDAERFIAVEGFGG
jgi:hypothetical protein